MQRIPNADRGARPSSRSGATGPAPGPAPDPAPTGPASTGPGASAPGRRAATVSSGSDGSSFSFNSGDGLPPRIELPGRQAYLARAGSTGSGGSPLDDRQSIVLPVSRGQSGKGCLRYAIVMPPGCPPAPGAPRRPQTAADQRAIQQFLAEGYMPMPFSTPADRPGAPAEPFTAYVKFYFDENADSADEDELTVTDDTITVTNRDRTSASASASASSSSSAGAAAAPAPEASGRSAARAEPASDASQGERKRQKRSAVTRAPEARRRATGHTTGVRPPQATPSSPATTPAPGAATGTSSPIGNGVIPR